MTQNEALIALRDGKRVRDERALRPLWKKCLVIYQTLDGRVTAAALTDAGWRAARRMK